MIGMVQRSTIQLDSNLEPYDMKSRALNRQLDTSQKVQKKAYTKTVDPDQIAPKGAFWPGSALFCHLAKDFAAEMSVQQFHFTNCK